MNERVARIGMMAVALACGSVFTVLIGDRNTAEAQSPAACACSKYTNVGAEAALRISHCTCGSLVCAVTSGNAMECKK
jgi:hypothetical protein